MAEVNQDLLDQLNSNLASFEAAGPAFEEDVKNIKAKIAKVQGGKASAPAKAATTAKKTTARRRKAKS
jgi:hypothetical protein